MKAKYVGDPRNPGEQVSDEPVEAHGLTFPKGKWVEVPANLAAKFAGNTHFETQGDAPEAEAK